MHGRLLGLISLAALACCKSSGGGTGDEPGSGSSSSSSGTIGGNADAGTITVDTCSAATQLVYVVSAQNDLHSFNPASGTFVKIGALDCPANAGSKPNSMAVDRTGAAWINYEDGNLYKASTANASCKATGFVPNQIDFSKFGMAFVSDAPGSTTESLFIVGLGEPAAVGKGFGRINLDDLSVTMLGDFTDPLSGRGAELTGTGDAKLYGFFATAPATLADIAHDVGATSNNTELTGIATRYSWAFTFWGGDFWFYTAAKGESSSVQRLRTSGDKQITTTNPDVGFTIVGAGVSTCAPTQPPK